MSACCFKMISTKKIVLLFIAILFSILFIYSIDTYVKSLPTPNHPSALLVSDDGVRYKPFDDSYDSLYYRYVIEGPTEGIYNFEMNHHKLKNIIINGKELTLQSSDSDQFLLLSKEKNEINIVFKDYPEYINIYPDEEKTRERTISFILLSIISVFVFLALLLFFLNRKYLIETIGFIMLIVSCIVFVLLAYLALQNGIQSYFYSEVEGVEYSEDGKNFTQREKWWEGIPTSSEDTFIQILFSRALLTRYYISVEPFEDNFIKSISLNGKDVCSSEKDEISCAGEHNLPLTPFRKNKLLMKIETKGDEVHLNFHNMVRKEILKLKLKNYFMLSVLSFGLTMLFYSLQFRKRTIMRRRGFFRSLIEK